MNGDQQPGVGRSSSGPSSLPHNLGLVKIPLRYYDAARAIANRVTEDDEPLLVDKLVKGTRKGRTHKEILDRLHGTNMHTASLWKEYYLENTARINSAVKRRMRAEQNDEGASEPRKKKKKMLSEECQSTSYSPPRKKAAEASRMGSASSRTSPASSSTIPAKRRRSKSSAPKDSLPVDMLSKATGTRRATVNSMTTFKAVYNEQLPPPNMEIQIPPPPTSCPSPPTIRIPKGKGFAFTPEDRDFFIKFIQWELEIDCSLTRQELAAKLAEKAPHHSAPSWASYWSNNHDLPDKILAAAHAKYYNQPQQQGRKPNDDAILNRRPDYCEVSSDEEDDDDCQSGGYQDVSMSEDEGPVVSYSVEDMGGPGSAYNDADFFMAAKHMAYFPNWDSAGFGERYEPLGRMYPQRSSKSWGEFFRREERRIAKLAKRIKDQGVS